MATTYDWSQRKIMVPEKEEIALSTNDLRVFYNGTKEAIHGVTMSFPKNEITALIGPSGSGKSTYLRALNRMNDTIDGARVTGEINYEGVNINENKVNVFEVRKQIGMVFQRPNPFPKSIYEIPGAKTCAIELRSFSKTAGFTGLRCGYTVVPHELVFDGTELNALWMRRQSTKFNGVSYITQCGAAAIYSEEGQKQIQENLSYYRENARLIYEG